MPKYQSMVVARPIVEDGAYNHDFQIITCTNLCTSLFSRARFQKQAASRMALEAALLLVHPERVERSTF